MHSSASTSGPRADKPVLGIARSSVGAKWVMAITGILFIGWIVLHLLGNLQVFRGGEAYNGYAAFLAKEPALLWGQRFFLAAIVVLHVTSGMRLARHNASARTTRYHHGYRYRRATWITRAMPFSGVLMLVFVLFHLSHFTLGWIGSENFGLLDVNGNHDLYTNVTRSFGNPGVTALYVGAMALLGLHLSHGVWSSIQTFGLYGHRLTPTALRAGRIVAFVIAAAFASIPLAILAGALRG